MTTADGNLGAAFGLVCAAGAATALGSSVVFFPSLVKLSSRRVLAASLGLSAGVMVYVSFVEIFPKSVEGFANGGEDDGRAYVWATLGFFGGVAIMKAVDWCVKRLSRESKPRRRNCDEDIEIVWNPDGDPLDDDSPEIVAPHCMGCAPDPLADLEDWHHNADLELLGEGDPSAVGTSQTTNDAETEDQLDRRTKAGAGGGEKTLEDPNKNNKGDHKEEGGESPTGESLRSGGAPKSSRGQDQDVRESLREGEEGTMPHVVVVVENVPRPPGDDDGIFRAPAAVRPNPKEERKRLVKMGLGTALAIALHNFPEGLATFVAALDDPSVGAVLAIAVGIHNVPEGLCVSLPIYYATGNRWRAFAWGCLSGLSEPVAALLGWLILARAMDDRAYGILFGLVAGMMVMISLKELIPTAHRYDPEDSVVTYSIIAGMAVMALSLVLFRL